MSRIQKWADIQEHLRLFGADIGYLALNLHGVKPASQVGRLDMTEDMVTRFLRKAIEADGADFNLDQGLTRPLASRGPSAPNVFRSRRDEDEDEDEDEDGEYEEGDEEDDEEEEEDDDDSPNRGLVLGSLASTQVERAIHYWLLATLNANTSAGRVATFRLRFMRHGAHSQLWSQVLDHASPELGEPPRSALAAVPTSAVEQMPWIPPAGSSQEVEKSSTPFDRVRALMNPSGNGNKPPLPAAPTQSAYPAPQYQPPRTPPYRPPAAGLGGDVSLREPTTYEVETLLHLHQISRDLASQAYAQVDRINESYRYTLEQISGIYGEALRHVGGALADSREHSDGLVNAMHAHKLEEVEKVMEAAESADKGRLKLDLGREAIQQLGLAARVYAAKRGEARSNGSNGSNGPIDPATAGEQEVPGEDEALDPTDEKAMGEAIEELGNWIVTRADVIDTLNDPYVRAYLQEERNVQQLRQLATHLGSVLGAEEPSPEGNTE